MKFIHTADIHIGMSNYSRLDPETGLDTRLLDFLRTFDAIVNRAIEENVDAFIFAGDAYKTRDPSPTQQRGFGERIKRLAKAKVPTIMVVGNHDTPNADGKANTLDIYSALEIDNVYVSRKVEFLKIPTKSGILQVITAPWLHKSEFKDLGEKLSQMYEKVDPKNPVILVGHLEVGGASMGSEKGLALINDATIPLSLLTDRKLCYVALGHIHKHQILSQNPPVVYSSSPERIDFSEENEPKGFMLVEVSKPGETKYQFIQTSARQFLTIRVDLKTGDENPTQTVLTEIKKYDLIDKVVKLVINIPGSINQDLEMDKIKKGLSEAHVIAGISRNVEKLDRPKIDPDGSEVESLTTAQALTKYLQSKQYSKDKIKSLENYAQTLLES